MCHVGLERVVAGGGGGGHNGVAGRVRALRLELDVDVSEGAEGVARTIAGGDHVVALGRLVDLRVELLLGARVTVLAHVAVLAHSGLEPVVALLDIGARRRAVLEHARVAATIARIVILRTREALATEARRPLARLSLVVDEHVGDVAPLGVLVERFLVLEHERQVLRLLAHHRRRARRRRGRRELAVC